MAYRKATSTFKATSTTESNLNGFALEHLHTELLVLLTAKYIEKAQKLLDGFWSCRCMCGQKDTQTFSGCEDGLLKKTCKHVQLWSLNYRVGAFCEAIPPKFNTFIEVFEHNAPEQSDMYI